MEPRKHLLTADQYQAMGAAGLFPPDQRLELIEGEVVEMRPTRPIPAPARGMARLRDLPGEGRQGFTWRPGPGHRVVGWP